MEKESTLLDTNSSPPRAKIWWRLLAMLCKMLSVLALALVAGAGFGAMAMARQLKLAGAGAMAEVPRFKLLPEPTSITKSKLPKLLDEEIDHNVGKANNVPVLRDEEIDHNARRANNVPVLRDEEIDHNARKANNVPAKHANLTVESKSKQPRVVVQDLYSHGEGFYVQIKFNGRLVHQLRVTEDGGIQAPKEAQILNLTAKVQQLVDDCKNWEMYRHKSEDLKALATKPRIELISAILAGSLLVLDMIHRVMHA